MWMKLLGREVARGIALAMLACLTVPNIAAAQETDRHHRKPVAQGVSLAARSARQSRDRALTIQRPPRGPYAEPYVGGDPGFLGQDDETIYGDVAGFNPAPYTTSGLQFPFGLDDVGGSGSDLGFDAGQDSSVYQR